MNRANVLNVIVLRSVRIAAIIAIAVFFSHHVTLTDGKIFERCELAHKLRYGHGVDLNDVANWVCIAQHSSSLNTSAFAGNAKIGTHGIFQISDEYWCSPPGKGVACNLPCYKLRDDDISDDFECVQKIRNEHQGLSGDGFNAWNAYQVYCKENPFEYIEDCFGNEEREYIRSKSITTNYVVDDDENSYDSHTSRGKVYGRCELAKELFLKHKMPMDEIPTWVCIAQHESHYDTSAVGRLNADGSADHGLFQISDLYWCSQKGGQRKACGLPCSKFLDSDITDDVKCVKQIHKEHTRISGDGFNAWTVYNAHCHEANEKYIRGCFDGIDVEESKISEQYKAYVKPSKGDTGKPHGKVYDPCELAEDLRNKYHLPEDQIATWVCIAKHESGYNTSAIGYGDHGLFQISDIYWCSPPGKGWACGLSCSELEDSDISDDVACIRKIYDEHSHLSGDGFNAWTVYPRYCSEGRADKYISHCPGRGETLRGAASYTSYSKALTSNSIEDYHPSAKGKVYGRCELANELLDKYHMPMEEIPTWVCIAHHESNFDTSAVGRLNADGSADHGLFQVSDLFWCSDDPDEYGKACGLPCSKLLDSDISDDVECVKQIHDEHTRISGDGFNAWTVYNAYCKDQSEQYIQGCFDGSASVEDFRPVPRILESGYRSKNKPKGKIYEDCELARELRDKHRIPKDQISSWVCIAKHQSGLNTSATSADSHGMFYISDEFWCSPPGKGKACELHCSDLEDSDITDDVECVKKIYDEHQRIYGNGFNAWRVYDQHCSNGRADDYTNQCQGFESTARNSINYGESQYKFGGRSIDFNKPVFDHEFKANPFLKHVDVVQSKSTISPFLNGLPSLNSYQNSFAESFSASEDVLSVNHPEYVRNPFLKFANSVTQKPTFKTTTATPSWKIPFTQSTTVSYPGFNNFNFNNFKSTKPAVPVKSYAWSTPSPTTMSEERAKYEYFMKFTTPPPFGLTVTPKTNRLQPYHLNTIKSSFETTVPFWLTTTTPKPSTSRISQNQVAAVPFWLTTTTPKPSTLFQFYGPSTPKSVPTTSSWRTTTTTPKPSTNRFQFNELTSQKSVAATPFWLTTTTQKPTTRLQSSSNIPFWQTTQKSTNIPFWQTSSTTQKPTTRSQSSPNIPFWQTTTTTQKPATRLQSSSNIPFWQTTPTTQKSTNIPFWQTSSTTQKPTTRFQSSSSNIPFWQTSSTTPKPTTRFQSSSSNIPFWQTSTTPKPTTRLQSSSSNIPFWQTSTTTTPKPTNIPFWQTSSTTPKSTTTRLSTVSPFGAVPFWLVSTTTLPPPTSRFQAYQSPTSTTKSPVSSKVIPLPVPTYQTSQVKSSTKLYATPSTTKAPQKAGQYNAGQYNSGSYKSGKYEAPKSSSLSTTTTTKIPTTKRAYTSTTKSPWNSWQVSTTTSKTTKYDPFRQFPPTTLKPKTTTTTYSKKSESSKSANLGAYVPYKPPTTTTKSPTTTKSQTTKNWNAWSTAKTTASTPTKPTTTKSTIKPSVTGSYAFSTKPKWTTSKPYTISTTLKPSLKPTQKFSFQFTTPLPKVPSSTSRSIANSTTPWSYVAPTKIQPQKSTTSSKFLSLQTIIPPWAITKTITQQPPTTTTTKSKISSAETTSSSKTNIFDLYSKLYGIKPQSGT